MQPSEASKVHAIEDLNKTAWNERVSNSSQSHELSEKALSLSKEIDYKKGKGEALRTLAFCYIRVAKLTEAIPLLEDAFQIFQDLENWHGQSDVYEYYGIINRSLGNYASSLQYLFKGEELRAKINYENGLSLSYYHIGITYKYLGDFEHALEYLLKSLDLGMKLNYWISISYSLNNIGVIYADMGDFQNAFKYYNQSLEMRHESGDQWGEAGCLDNIGLLHLKLNETTQAEQFCLKSLLISESNGDKKGKANSLHHLGMIFAKKNDFEKAIEYFNQSLKIRTNIGDKKGQAELLILLSDLQLKNNSGSNEAIENRLKMALEISTELNAKDLLSNIYYQFYLFYKYIGRQSDALAYLEIHTAFEKELFNKTISQKIANLQIGFQVEQSKKEAELYRLKNVELVNLNNEIQSQKDILEQQSKHLEETLSNLKSTQTQLIQSEKLASLGELTAGIAHEIQNPLNFVNNFSEVSAELVQEIKEERQKPKENQDESLIDEIFNDISQNLEKITLHGKRASSIVKGMLEHSRTSTGVKELTDINQLADEYLLLSYHGIRAKDNNFNSDYQTDFDENLPKIEVISQDIGRVLLNLINNAFWAVASAGTPAAALSHRENYKPLVVVKTEQTENQIIIKVSDNGVGMSEATKGKIFQPFFTTKPTGQGTGLGLSLAYDIVTKGHGGTLEVETPPAGRAGKEGEGTTFIVKLSTL